MPDDSRPAAEEDCPIIFELPDGSEPAEEERAMQLCQEEVEDQMEVEPSDDGTISGACCDQSLHIFAFQQSLLQAGCHATSGAETHHGLSCLRQHCGLLRVFLVCCRLWACFACCGAELLCSFL